eukprot:m.599112 g.599112  ORF g.599112 m.599112 type:complete len:469 (+) comp22423_c0_seq35:254-1660(+)
MGSNAAIQLVGVTVTVTAILLFVMHSRMLSLESELSQTKLRLMHMEHEHTALQSRDERTMCQNEAPQEQTNISAKESASGGPHFLAGYSSAASVQNAVVSGIDVRLVQDHLPLRAHPAHHVTFHIDNTVLPDPADIRIGYDECVRKINAGRGAPPISLQSPEYVHWLHLPKCGSSFGAVLHGLVCQADPSPPMSPYTGEPCDYCGAAATKGPRWDSILHPVIDFDALPYCNWNVTTSTPRANFRNHVPLPLNKDPMQKWMNVGLFRDPRKRLVSGWNHDKHAMGIAGKERIRFETDVQTIEQYTQHRNIPACMTKMLIGAYCARTRNITQHAFEEARRRLSTMGFVGLTDAFDASSCLFCRMFNVTPQPYMFGSSAQARPGSDHKKHPLPGGGVRVSKDYWQRLSPSVDPLDWEIYTMAKSLFLARLQHYGLYDMDYRPASSALTRAAVVRCRLLGGTVTDQGVEGRP